MFANGALVALIEHRAGSIPRSARSHIAIAERLIGFTSGIVEPAATESEDIQ